MTAAALAFAISALLAPASPEAGNYLYRAELVQAAPGRLLDLIDLEKALGASFGDRGDEAPFAMRHSQGDKWDLLLLYPMGSWGEYYGGDRIARRERWKEASRASLEKIRAATAWQEDVFVRGSRAVRRPRSFREGRLLPRRNVRGAPREGRRSLSPARDGKRVRPRARPPAEPDLRPRGGAAWDLFTVGAYRDLKHYAEGSAIGEAAQESAAKGAGFESAKAIGPYLRTLIREHHDTLATAVR